MSLNKKGDDYMNKIKIHIEVDELGFVHVYSSNRNVEVDLFDYCSHEPGLDDDKDRMFKEHEKMVANETLKFVF